MRLTRPILTLSPYLSRCLYRKSDLKRRETELQNREAILDEREARLHQLEISLQKRMVELEIRERKVLTSTMPTPLSTSSLSTILPLTSTTHVATVTTSPPSSSASLLYSNENLPMSVTKRERKPLEERRENK